MKVFPVPAVGQFRSVLKGAGSSPYTVWGKLYDQPLKSPRFADIAVDQRRSVFPYSR